MPSSPHFEPPKPGEQWVIRIMILIGILSLINFAYWFFHPDFRGNSYLFAMLSVIFGYGILRHLYIWYHYAAISVPKIPESTQNYTVDVFTTYFPGEPLDMVENTLRAIEKIDYPHTTYLCDEADNPYLRNLCSELGIQHITRDSRVDAKAGNINNALRLATGEICLILDPDHVPQSDILDHILPHFSDSRVGFVQIVQAYYNIRKSLVAKGAAEQTYQFYGPMMMTMNSYGTVNAIGANCTFRRSALNSIEGHAPGLAEDMHTAMRLYAKGWKSVYVPKILARGLVPETLLTHFNQQLKWSRGTFDLLLRVYPRLFPKFSFRQKLHFALLPLHFLIGLIYLLGFLIPIGSLIFSTTPWTGNIIVFLLAILPVWLSTLLIRAYIQKWVIESKERGFHLVGGLLQISTWWIHFLGFIYAIIGKTVPYLPTEKKESQVTNLRIVIPNLLIGIVSVSAIIYGLNRDFTPFSLVMAGFAALNAGFMVFSLYLATSVTNKNRIIRDQSPKWVQRLRVTLIMYYRKTSRTVFHFTRRVALPLLLLGTLTTAFQFDHYLYDQWEGITSPLPYSIRGPDYTGIYYPTDPSGLSDMDAINDLRKNKEVEVDLISIYLAWGDDPINQVPEKLVQEIYEAGSIPFITWEPWTNSFKSADTLVELRENTRVFKKILEGRFDSYIHTIAQQLKALKTPVFLRFAHEFDNPAYPWSPTGRNTPEDFRKAWRYVNNQFKRLEAFNVIWVWNPLDSASIPEYFPGEAYVDWIGITALNYGILNRDGQWHRFDSIYKPFDAALTTLPDLPVMLTEFGSLNLGGNGKAWVSEGLLSSKQNYPKIKGWILFNSAWDRNIPKNTSYDKEYLDWTGSLGSFRSAMKSEKINAVPSPSKPEKINRQDYIPKALPQVPIKGIHYKKGQLWFSDHYILDRPTLEKDIFLLKNIGLNTLRIDDPGVYSRNLLQLTKEQDLQVIYSFRMPDSLDFRTDYERWKKFAQKVLETVERNKHESHIVAWNFGNSSWHNLRRVFARPELDFQRSEFLQRFESLCSEIKKRDPERHLFMDVEISQGTEELFFEVQENNIPIDAAGLVINEAKDITPVREAANRYSIPHYISDVRVQDLDDLFESHVVLHNWQDQWESNRISFDGLLNHIGQKKPTYFELEAKWKGISQKKAPTNISILRPAFPLKPGDQRTFYAKIYQRESWRQPKFNEAEGFSWFLIKKGEYGESIGLKFLGNGSEILLEIPEEFNKYQLMLSYQKEGLKDPAIAIRMDLGTPIYAYE